MSLHATYWGEDLTVCFTADEEWGDDPSTSNICNIRISAASVCGVELDLTASRDLVNALMDKADDLEWQEEAREWAAE